MSCWAAFRVEVAQDFLNDGPRDTDRMTRRAVDQNVKKFAEALKEKKCEEERKGIATKTVTTFLTYTPAKM